VEDDSIFLNMVYLEKRNDQNFKDYERMVTELKAFFFKTLYHWMTAYSCLHISSVHEFFYLLTFS
jgi:hypothetical protein